MNALSNNVNAAIVSGQLGLQRASDGITQASTNIAQRVAGASPGQPRDVNDVLADAASQSLSSIRQVLPSGGDSLTNDLVGLSVNSINAQASAKVLDTVNDTVGRIIDELA
ncbi:hypothetical protein [Aestuariibacter salexigens]|uniref:hypothetical protein n=1 Tax=Aestuariibacter salexigens TaxID=226010 RepID=UPI0004129CA4|nr:hypothetical protein [Aestuariibacter salexigens]